MTVYETMHIDTKVTQRLTAYKKALEETYKIDLTWSHFLYLLVKDGQPQEITIEDIMETPAGILEFDDLIYEPTKLVNGYAKK